MKVLLRLIPLVISITFTSVATAEICTRVTKTVKINPGFGEEEAESSWYFFEQALDVGDITGATNYHRMIINKRFQVQKSAKENAYEMCKNNIWDAFNKLTYVRDLCADQSSSTVTCKMNGQTLRYLPAPSTITCEYPSSAELQLDYYDSLEMQQPETMEHVYASAYSKPSSSSITMTYDCIPVEKREGYSRY